jgi:hypothetical protein
MLGRVAADTTPRDADVVLDVELERGVLFFVLENIGDSPAHEVRCAFSEPVHGLGGEQRVDALRIFNALEFMAPRRRIRVPVDRAALYFARNEPIALSIEVSWHDDDGSRRSRAIRHDLDVYRDLPYLEVRDDD